MAHRYRICPDPDQMAALVRHCGDARAVWNLALEQANYWRRGRSSSPGSAERFRQLAEARKDSWLGEGSSSVQSRRCGISTRRCATGGEARTAGPGGARPASTRVSASETFG